MVVDLSSGIAGAYATKLLADGGADVVKVEDPDGDPLRRWSASGAPVAPGDDGALFSFLASSKRSVVVDVAEAGDRARLDALLARADAVVWSEGSRVAADESWAPAALRRAHPDLVVTTVTPFGLDGPWAGRAATEFTLQAWSGGCVGLGRGAPARSPLFVGGQVGEWLSGAYAAIGTLVSLGRTGRGDGGDGGEGEPAGELVDVAMLEVLATCLTYYPVTFAEIAGRPYRSGRSVPSPGVETASDGLVGLGTGTGQQWLDLCVMVGHPEWADDPLMRTERWRIAPAIREWAAARTVAEIIDLAGAFRIPHAPVGNGATIPVTDHFVARGSLVANPRDGFLQPGVPYRITPPMLREPTPAPRLGEHTDDIQIVAASSRRFERRARHGGGARREGGSARRVARARSHRVLGGAGRYPDARDARRRGDPRRVAHAPRRHPHAREPAVHRRPVVGALRHLLRTQRRQAERHPRSRRRARPRRAAHPARHV